MFVGIWMIIVMWISIYWGLRLVTDEYHAKAIATFIYIGVFIAGLCMAVGLLWIAVLGPGNYFKEICFSTSILTWYEAHFMGPKDAFIGYIGYPYIAFLQSIVWYLDILFHHFNFVFIFSHGLGLYIMSVVYRFSFDWNKNGVVGDNHFGIKRDKNGRIIR